MRLSSLTAHLQVALMAGVVAGMVAATCQADVVISMPPPKKLRSVAADVPSAALQGNSSAATGMSDAVPPDVGLLALNRYASARRAPHDTYSSFGYPYNGYRFPGYYPSYGYSWGWWGFPAFGCFGNQFFGFVGNPCGSVCKPCK